MTHGSNLFVSNDDSPTNEVAEIPEADDALGPIKTGQSIKIN